MILNLNDARYAANYIIGYYKNFDRLDGYFRERKLDRVEKIPDTLFGISHEDDIFSDFSMNPQDMNFNIYEANNEKFTTLLEITASYTNENSPGKQFKLFVEETNTKKIVGMIKFGSPMINSRPRNIYFDCVPELPLINKHAIMGFIIVPTQPFGYNYLGGKLLAGMCCSHYVREMLNEKYNTEICMFETTSLYGSIKDSSQYDGMRPFLKYKGETESKFVPILGDEHYKTIRKWFEEKNDGIPLISKEASSRKLKYHNVMIGIIKKSLKKTSEKEYKQFCIDIETAKGINTRKRYYLCEYGFDNVKDILSGRETKLKPGKYFDKFKLDNVVNWWKKKAEKRWNNLQTENRLKTELEIFNTDSVKNIEIIR